MSNYQDEHRRSLADPAAFWGEQAQHLHWHRPWDKVLDEATAPLYRWFSGAQFNTCYNALDRHVDGGRADQAALIYDSPVTGGSRTYTYRELRDAVARFAGALRDNGVKIEVFVQHRSGLSGLGLCRRAGGAVVARRTCSALHRGPASRTLPGGNGGTPGPTTRRTS